MKAFHIPMKVVNSPKIPHLDQNVTIQQLKSENEFLKKQLRLLMERSCGLQQIQLQNMHPKAKLVNKIHQSGFEKNKHKQNQDNAEDFYKMKMEKLKSQKVLRRSLSRDKKSSSLDHRQNKNCVRIEKDKQFILETLHIRTQQKERILHSPPMSPKSIVCSQKSEHPTNLTQIASNQSQKTILPLVNDPRIIPMVLSKDKNGRIYRQKDLEQTFKKQSKHKRANSDAFSKRNTIQNIPLASQSNMKTENIKEKSPPKQISPIKKICSPKKCSIMKSNVYFDHLQLQDMQKQADKMCTHDMQQTKVKFYGANDKNKKSQNPAAHRKFSGFYPSGTNQIQDEIARQIKEVQRTGKKRLNYNIYLNDEQENKIK